MADDYKDKLDAFLKKVPQPGQVNSGSPQYKPELKAVIVADTLTVVENPDFKDLTGLTHKALLKNWARSKIGDCWLPAGTTGKSYSRESPFSAAPG